MNKFNAKGEKSAAAKAEMKKSLYALYGDEPDVITEDLKYEKLMGHFDRISRILSAQSMALDHLEKKVTIILKRREEREAMNPKELQQLR